MKKIVLMVIVALGVMLTSTSCGAQVYYGYQQDCPAYVPGVYGTYQTTAPSPTGLFVKSKNLRVMLFLPPRQALSLTRF